MGTSWVGLKPHLFFNFFPPDKSGGNCLFIIQLELDEFDFVFISILEWIFYSKKINRDWL
jgi:hypothetical protein